MGKSKYCYVIVNKENGSMLFEDGKLPIYWNKKTAKSRRDRFGVGVLNKYIVHKLILSDIENMILSSNRA